MIVFKKLMELSNLMSGLVKDMKEMKNPMIVFKKLMKDVANLMSGLVKDVCI